MKLDRFNAAIEPLWVFLHRGHIVRRVILFYALWMVYDSYEWAKQYALTDAPDQFIYTAVLGVPSLLFAAAIKLYNDGRAAKPIDEK